MDPVQYRPIGVVHSPFTELEGTPIQAAAAEGVTARIEEFHEFELGLKDLEGFSHVILLDGTPLLDIKPYVPAFDVRQDASTGWLEGHGVRLSTTIDDGRFS